MSVRVAWVALVLIVTCDVMITVQTSVITELHAHRASESDIELRWSLARPVHEQNVTYRRSTPTETTRCENVHMTSAEMHEHVISGLSADTRYRVCLEVREAESDKVQMQCELMSTSRRIHTSSGVALVLALLVLALIIGGGVLAWHCAKRREARDYADDEREPLEQHGIEDNHTGIEDKQAV